MWKLTRSVRSTMFCHRHEAKVFQSVIPMITVDVVNDKTSGNRAMGLFPNPTVFQKPLAVSGDRVASSSQARRFPGPEDNIRTTMAIPSPVMRSTPVPLFSLSGAARINTLTWPALFPITDEAEFFATMGRSTDWPSKNVGQFFKAHCAITGSKQSLVCGGPF